MALTETPPETAEAPAREPVAAPPPRTDPTIVERVVGTGDNQLIGRMFVLMSLLFGAAAIVAGSLRDFDVASGFSLFNGSASNRLFQNAAPGVLLLGIVPLLVGIAICVVPRQLGSPAIAFHRAASAAFWGWLGSAVLFIVAESADGGYGGGNLKMARLGNLAVGGMMVALMLASICIAVTVLSYRPLGMTLDRVPFFSWAMFVASTIWVLTFPAAIAHVLIGQIAHFSADTLANRTWGGITFLFVQPAIYAVFIPVLGIVLDVVATATGGRQRFRGASLGLIGAFGLLSFGAWAQGSVGHNDAFGEAFGRPTFIWAGFCLAVAIPLLATLGGAADTLRQGRIKLISPLVFSLFALLLGLLAWADGGIMVINTAGRGNLTDWQVDSLGQGQFRLVVGAAFLAALGACFYWSKQIFGSSIQDIAGKGLAPLGALAVAVWGVAPVLSGIIRGSAVKPMAGLTGAGGCLLALVILGTLGGALGALRTSLRGDVVGPDPWGGGGTLEWTDADQPAVESAYPALDGIGGAAS